MTAYRATVKFGVTLAQHETAKTLVPRLNAMAVENGDECGHCTGYISRDLSEELRHPQLRFNTYLVQTSWRLDVHGACGLARKYVAMLIGMIERGELTRV